MSTLGNLGKDGSFILKPVSLSVLEKPELDEASLTGVQKGCLRLVQMLRKLSIVFSCVVVLNLVVVGLFNSQLLPVVLASNLQGSIAVLKLTCSWECVLGLFSIAFLAEKLSNFICML